MGNVQLIHSQSASISSLPLLVGILAGGHIVEISYSAGVKCKLDAIASEFPQLAAVIQDINPSATVASPLAAVPLVAVAHEIGPSAINTFPQAAAKSFDSLELADQQQSSFLHRYWLSL